MTITLNPRQFEDLSQSFASLFTLDSINQVASSQTEDETGDDDEDETEDDDSYDEDDEDDEDEDY